MSESKVEAEKEYSGTGSRLVYRVEARTTNDSPHKYNNFIITRDWRDAGELFIEHPFVGVPNRLWCDAAEGKGFLSYECAMAMAAWLHAAVYPFGSMIETRLVEIRFKYNFSHQEQGVSEPLKVLSHYGRDVAKFAARVRPTTSTTDGG